MITLTQLAKSAEPMQFAIAAIDGTGASIDPTIWAPEVTFAAVTSPPAAFDPDTATWTPATWSVQAGPPATYWVNIEPGPGGIGVTAGSYIAYTKIITDSQHSRGPVLPSAYAVFT